MRVINVRSPLLLDCGAAARRCPKVELVRRPKIVQLSANYRCRSMISPSPLSRRRQG